LETEFAPKSGKSQNRPNNTYNRPWGAISPTLNATDLDKGFNEFAKTTRNVGQLY